MWPVLQASPNSLPTEIIDLVLGPSLRFLMSHWGKNSVKYKVIGKKWIYLERNTLLTESGHLRGQVQPWKHTPQRRVWAITESK